MMDKTSDTKQPMQVDVVPSADAVTKSLEAQKNFVKNTWAGKVYLVFILLVALFIAYCFYQVFFGRVYP